MKRSTGFFWNQEICKSNIWKSYCRYSQDHSSGTMKDQNACNWIKCIWSLIPASCVLLSEFLQRSGWSLQGQLRLRLVWGFWHEKEDLLRRRQWEIVNFGEVNSDFTNSNVESKKINTHSEKIKKSTCQELKSESVLTQSRCTFSNPAHRSSLLSFTKSLEKWEKCKHCQTIKQFQKS